MDIDPIYLILIAIFSGIGVELGKVIFDQIKKRWHKYKDQSKEFGKKIGSIIAKDL